MEKLNENAQNYLLRLRRENLEYMYGSWYKHYWNEIFEIKVGIMQKSRGEKIIIDNLTEEQIFLTFFDELTTNEGVSCTLSLSEPRVCLRSKRSSGGSNEFAWSRSDYVEISLEKINSDG